MNILHIDSSPFADGSVSRELTASIVAGYRTADPAAQVIYRDLGQSAPDHLCAELMQVVKLQKAEDLTDRQKIEVAQVDAFVSELLAADVVVIGAPMYNFTIPTQLKAWIDRLAQPGRTFRYTASGPEGLAGGRKVIIASSRGGFYSTSEQGQAIDHQEAYLRTFFGFLGISDVTVVRAEGIGYGPEARDKALTTAKGEIAVLTAA